LELLVRLLLVNLTPAALLRTTITVDFVLGKTGNRIAVALELTILISLRKRVSNPTSRKAVAAARL
jgi:hypothetical protein